MTARTRLILAVLLVAVAFAVIAYANFGKPTNPPAIEDAP